MGFRIPLPVVNKAHQANQLYPSAISLLESVRTYDSINERVADKRGVALLVAAYKREIQNQISEVCVSSIENHIISFCFREVH